MEGIPAIGLGVYDMGAQTAPAVETAIKLGYRLIDTAAIYNNERQVGEGIRGSSIDRSELFITTKLWLTDYGNVRAAFDLSLRKLGTDYVDLYLLHWPCPRDFVLTLAAYQEMIALQAEGRIRHIGVSNFTIAHLKALPVRPAVNQVELHPLFNHGGLRAFAKANGIALQAWSPLGGTQGQPLAHPMVTAIAREHGKTPAQIVLRWHIEHGLSAVPKSVRPERLRENFDVFDFALDPVEIAALDALETGKRSSPHPDHVHAGTWPVRVAA